jgi:hypothetical protein
MKRFLGILLVMFMVSAMALPVFAAPANGKGKDACELKGSGSAFDYNGWTNAFDKAIGEVDVTYWHFVDSGTNGNKNPEPSAENMVLYFKNAENEPAYTFIWERKDGFSLNGGGKNAGWVVVTPSSWVSVSGSVDNVLNQFNLSGKVTVLGKRFVTPMFSGAPDVYIVNDDKNAFWKSTWTKSDAYINQAHWVYDIDPNAVWTSFHAEPVYGDLQVFKFDYTIEGNVVTGGTDFIVAADNGFVMLINGKPVKNSDLIARFLGDLSSDYLTDGKVNEEGARVLREGEIDPEELYFAEDWDSSDPSNWQWRTVYTVYWDDIKSFFKVGENAIEIIAYNTTALKPDGSLHDSSYESNPAGVLFAGVVYSQSK